MDRGAWLATVHGVTKEPDTTEQLTLSLSSTLENVIPQSHRNCDCFQRTLTSRRVCRHRSGRGGHSQGPCVVAGAEAAWPVPTAGQRGSCMCSHGRQPSPQTSECKERPPVIDTDIKLSFLKASLTIIQESKN